MQLFNIIFERMPMVWFLLGLLFSSLALYLGIESSLFFAYLFLGLGCCAYGLTIFALRFLDRPKQTEATRLSPNFISAGATTMMPSPALEPQRGEAPESREQALEA